MRPRADVAIGPTPRTVITSGEQTGLSFFDEIWGLRNGRDPCPFPYWMIHPRSAAMVEKDSLRWYEIMYQEDKSFNHIGFLPDRNQDVGAYLLACRQVILSGEILEKQQAKSSYYPGNVGGDDINDNGGGNGKDNGGNDGNDGASETVPSATETGTTTSETHAGTTPSATKTRASTREDAHRFECLNEAGKLFVSCRRNRILSDCVSNLIVVAERCQRRYCTMLNLLKEFGDTEVSKIPTVWKYFCCAGKKTY